MTVLLDFALRLLSLAAFVGLLIRFEREWQTPRTGADGWQWLK